MHKILIAFCCIALLGQVAYGAEHEKVPKTEIGYSVDQLSTTFVAIPVAVEIVMYAAPIEAELKIQSLSNGYSLNGLIPECVPIPSGNVMYLKTLKPFYISPNIDDKWKWQYSQLYNC